MTRLADYIEYFAPQIDSALALVKSAEGGALIGEELLPRLRQLGLNRIRRVTEDYMLMRMAELLEDENPFASLDTAMITKREREKLQPVLLELLRSGKLVLPERMRATIGTILRNYTDFLLSLFLNLSRHREAICACLFDGRPYTTVTKLSARGDTHNHGRCTVILETDAGKLVYKPHSCRVDVAAHTFINRYFADVVCLPRAFAWEDEFGAVEFLEKRIAEGEAEAKRYYYALGGTAAIIKALGTVDMHMENLFAVGDRLALIDLETLLYPQKREFASRLSVLYGEEEARRLQDSLLVSALLNVRLENANKNIEKEYSILFNDEPDGSAPLVDGVRRTVHDYEKEFFQGFAALYQRCVEQRERIAADIEALFSSVVFRVIIAATRTYAETLTRLNSRFSYDSEEYHRAQLEKLPELLRHDRAELAEEVFACETRALLDCEIPFFYTFGGSTALWCDGRIVQADYALSSPVERTLRILAGLNEKELAFETAYTRLSMSMSKRKTAGALKSAASTEPITAEEAEREAFRIMGQICDSAIRLESGELTWLGFSPSSASPGLMEHGFYSGTVGLSVFFAAVEAAAEDEAVKAQARECLESVMRRLRRLLAAKENRRELSDEARYPLGESGGFAGMMRGLVLANRILGGVYGDLLEEGIARMAEIDPGTFQHTDKAGGIAGLITTICQHEELCSDERMRALVERLAERLSALRTLPYGDGHLWKTLYDTHPISGAVHGMMGVAEAFLLADKLLGTDRFASDAQAALAFEDGSYNEKLETWMDLRLPGNNKPAGGNCYGAEGVGVILSRLQKAGLGNEVVDRCAKRAAVTVSRLRDRPLDHLCCGNMSVVEYYLETDRLPEAGARLTTVLRTKEANGRYRLGFAGYVPNDNVTLFYGLAGIGYELLRYAHPGRFPSVV